MIGTARDTTGRKLLELKLAAAEKFESLGVMAAGMAHDFNNLLLGVIGSASLAQQMLARDHKSWDLLTDVIAAGEDLASLTAQMLAYSGKGQSRVRPVEVSTVACEAAAAIRSAIGPGTDLILDLQPGVTVAGDADQLGQVMVSLLRNAVESFDRASGRIFLRVQTQEIDDQYIRRGLKNADIGPGVFVKIEVQDTGSGIEESIQGKIFDPFFSTKFAGRGLGLAAVSGIVRAHKGAIQVTSKVGVGTTVTVLLPAESARKPAGNAGASPTCEGDCPTVLVVDDEEMVAELAAKILRTRGYGVVTVNNGLPALDRIEKQEPEISLVLLDLTMPGISGWETLRRIRQIDQRLPVILSSGYSKEQALAKVNPDDISAFLPKPYRSDELIRIVAELLGTLSERDIRSAPAAVGGEKENSGLV